MSRLPTFGAWIDSQLIRRQMSQADLARRLETSNSTVSNWIRGGRVPTPESCDKIADVLGLSVDDVLMAAGHRPRGLDEWPEDVREVANIMVKLPEQHREEIVEFSRWRYERARSKHHA